MSCRIRKDNASATHIDFSERNQDSVAAGGRAASEAEQDVLVVVSFALAAADG